VTAARRRSLRSLPSIDVTLVPFDQASDDLIGRWARSPEELEAWCGRSDFPLDPAVVRGWHVDPDVHPFVLLVDGAPAGYGEVWEDHKEEEAELARVIVDPAARGRGLGQRLTTLLAGEARQLGFADVWLRVLPSNGAALACYARAGFRRATADEEETFNRGQPRDYAWMRLTDSPG
jgi:ribosomal protein S18 acetylase RimI-like enzyme